MKRHLASPHEGTSQRTSEHGTDFRQQVDHVICYGLCKLPSEDDQPLLAKPDDHRRGRDRPELVDCGQTGHRNASDGTIDPDGDAAGIRIGQPG